MGNSTSRHLSWTSSSSARITNKLQASSTPPTTSSSRLTTSLSTPPGRQSTVSLIPAHKHTFLPPSLSTTSLLPVSGSVDTDHCRGRDVGTGAYGQVWIARERQRTTTPRGTQPANSPYGSYCCLKQFFQEAAEELQMAQVVCTQGSERVLKLWAVLADGQGNTWLKYELASYGDLDRFFWRMRFRAPEKSGKAGAVGAWGWGSGRSSSSSSSSSTSSRFPTVSLSDQEDLSSALEAAGSTTTSTPHTLPHTLPESFILHAARHLTEALAFIHTGTIYTRTPSGAVHKRQVHNTTRGTWHPIIHQDMKPGNTLLTSPSSSSIPSPSWPSLILADFGCSHFLGSPTPASGSNDYQPAHTEPPGGPLTDMWGLGAILYFLATGTPPVEPDVKPDRRAFDGDEEAYRRAREAYHARPRTWRSLEEPTVDGWVYSRGLGEVVGRLLCGVEERCGAVELLDSGLLDGDFGPREGEGVPEGVLCRLEENPDYAVQDWCFNAAW